MAKIMHFFYGYLQVAVGEQYMLEVASMIKSAAWIYNIDKSLLGDQTFNRYDWQISNNPLGGLFSFGRILLVAFYAFVSST